MCPITHDVCFSATPQGVAKTLQLALYLDHRDSWSETLPNFYLRRYLKFLLCQISLPSPMDIMDRWRVDRRYVFEKLLAYWNLLAIVSVADRKQKSRPLRHILNFEWIVTFFVCIFYFYCAFCKRQIFLETLLFFLRHGYDTIALLGLRFRPPVPMRFLLLIT